MTGVHGEVEAWGVRLRRWRDETQRWSQQDLVDHVVQLAYQTNQERGTRLDVRLVGRWENGAVSRPQSVYRRLLGQLGAPLPDGAATTRPPAPAGESADGPAQLAPGLIATDFLWTPGRAGDSYLADIQSCIAALVSVDNKSGGAEVSRLSETVFDAVRRRLGSRDYDPALRTDLLASTGELAEVAGWLAYDADRQDVARQMNHEALGELRRPKHLIR